jgi:uncharacterized DUF497 family protein
MFVWDQAKNKANQEKHGVSFETAQAAFGDARRLIIRDASHSTESESRFFCFGKVHGGILTVRFTWRDGKIRIIGAGFWRQGRKRYEEVHS